MPASLRFEIFPANLDRCIKFYTEILRFTVVSYKPEMGYAFMQRDAIFIGAVVKEGSEYPNGYGAETQYRNCPTGVELIFEFDDLDDERNWVVGKQWPLEEDLKLQIWGLRDFRIKDQDGYYIRITTNWANRKSHE